MRNRYVYSCCILVTSTYSFLFSDENSDDDVFVIENREAEAVVAALTSASTSKISENVAVENQTMKIPPELG